jgi:hypothetical protein
MRTAAVTGHSGGFRVSMGQRCCAQEDDKGEILHTRRRIVIHLRNSKNFILNCRSTKISLLFLKLLSVAVRIHTGSSKERSMLHAHTKNIFWSTTLFKRDNVVWQEYSNCVQGVQNKTRRLQRNTTQKDS